MPCIAAPKLPPLTLPFPLTITPPPLPKLKFDATICCINLSFATPPIPIKIPSLVINPASVLIITQALSKVNAFLDKLQIRCPKEA